MLVFLSKGGIRPQRKDRSPYSHTQTRGTNLKIDYRDAGGSSQRNICPACC
jgi:hypothetical protein